MHNSLRYGSHKVDHRQPAHTIFVCLLAALLYALPISSIPYYSMKDHANYVGHVLNGMQILGAYSGLNILLLPFQEPLWFAAVSLLGRILSPEATIQAMSIVPAFITAALVAKAQPRNYIAILLILTFPLVLKNNTAQIRQGVAIMFFLAGLLSERRQIKIVLMGLAPLIHVGFYIIGAVWIVTWAISRMRLSSELKVASIATICCLITITIPLMAVLTEARQGNEYQAIDPQGSGLAAIFWAGILAIFISGGREYINNNLFSIALLVSYLALYIFSPLAGRIWEAGVLFVLLSGFRLPGWQKGTFVLAIAAYSLLLYARAWGLPWPGYGLA
ncbi:hypothetical protein O9Z70_13370 [Devosia sp. YIM 151766]|uniref:EpsG family protein n=1 Tax=Devosia sp. YIM 151766 TaxID=3017325 RepID=UPI00255C7793|nr:EpsG family protein [Devosia sp. YIM 151766]WIY52439.1 hypothetical protein O9Z70_13370 [Devosia sp. YIM 151766]